MTGVDIGVLVFGYVVLGALSAAVTLLFDERFIGGDDDPGFIARQFTIGALWPIALIAALGYGLCVGISALVRSYAALWRSWRPRRDSLPEARAVRSGRRPGER